MCGQEVVYVRALMESFGYPQKRPTNLWEDNQSCIHMSESPKHRKYSRHIDTRRYYCRDQVRDGILKLRKCAGPLNVADANTKSLPSPAFVKHRDFMWGSRVPFAAFDYQNMPKSTEMTEAMIVPDFSKLDISRNFPRGQTAGG